MAAAGPRLAFPWLWVPLLATGLLLAACGPEPARLPWLTDFSQAQTQAREQNKLLLMDFTGSDWCRPCQTLRRYLLDTREFATYASNNLVLLEVDFPHWASQSEAQKKANEALQATYSVEGYPTVIVLSPAGVVLGRQAGVQQTKPGEFIAWIEDLRRQSPPGAPHPPAAP